MMRRKSKLYLFFLLFVGTCINMTRVYMILSKVFTIHEKNIVSSILHVMKSINMEDHSLRGWIYLPPIRFGDWLLCTTFFFLIIWSLISLIGLISILADYVCLIALTTIIYSIGVFGESINVIITPIHEPVLFFPLMMNIFITEMLIVFLCYLTYSKVQYFIGANAAPSQVANQVCVSVDSKDDFHETPL